MNNQKNAMAKVVAVGDSLAVTIPDDLAEQLKLTVGSTVQIEMLANQTITIRKIDPKPSTPTDPKFLAAAKHAKDKYAQTLKMLRESDE